MENLGLGKTELSPPTADSGAASSQSPSEAAAPSDDPQEETDTSLKSVEEDTDEANSPPS